MAEEESIYVDRYEAARIIGVTPAQVDNLAKDKPGMPAQLTNVGEAGRYARPKFLRSQCVFLSDPKNRRPMGRQYGYRKVKVGA